MYGYTRWHWKAQDYSSCIVLYPLQVGCHIMSRTKQQWVTVVNSLQNKSRYKCGSCSTCQESPNRCKTTWFKVACPSNIGDITIVIGFFNSPWRDTLSKTWQSPGILCQFDFFLQVLWQSRSRLEEVGCHMIFFFWSHVVHQIVFCG